MRELARIHAPVLGDPELGGRRLAQPAARRSTRRCSAQLLPASSSATATRIAPEHRELVRAVRREPRRLDRRPPAARSASCTATTGSTTCCSARTGSARPLTVVDWQTVSWGPAMLDASYFLGAGLDRRGPPRARGGAACASTTTSSLALGVDGLRLGRVLGGVPPPGLPRRADGGGAVDARRAHRARRRHVHDLARAPRAAGASTSTRSTLLPDAGHGPTAAAAARPRPTRAATRPGPRSSGTRAGTSTPSPRTAALGAYVRLGLYPNLGVAWYTAFVCGPGPPDGRGRRLRRAAARRRATCAVDTARSRPSTAASAPLERFARHARRHRRARTTTPRRCCAASEGEPVRVALDLTWETDGEPYAYRLATRYEIPCRVRGHDPGRRRGARAARPRPARPLVGPARLVGDGLGVERRRTSTTARASTPSSCGCPTLPRIGVGYVQPPGGERDRARRASTATEEVGATTG